MAVHLSQSKTVGQGQSILAGHLRKKIGRFTNSPNAILTFALQDLFTKE